MFSGGCRVSFLDLGRGSLGEKKSVMWATSVFYRGIKIVNQLSEPRRKFPPNSRAGCCQSLSDLGFVMICSSIKPCRGWVRKGSNPSLFLRSSGSFPAPRTGTALQEKPCRSFKSAIAAFEPSPHVQGGEQRCSACSCKAAGRRELKTNQSSQQKSGCRLQQ